MFRRQKKLDVPNHGNVQKSRSMEILSSEEGGGRGAKRIHEVRSTTSVDSVLSEWQQLSLLKIASPCVTCLLPHLSEDFVCSALLAIGATPLMTEDPGDIDRDIENSKAVVLDVSAPASLVEAFVNTYQQGSLPLVLVVSQAGTSDRKRDLAVEVIERCRPTVVLGRRGDVYALSQAILEKSDVGNLDTESGDGSGEKTDSELTTSLPVPRTIEHRPVSPARYRKKPSSTAPPSPGPGSGGSTPVAVAKKIQQQGKGFKRLPSVNPLLLMKGQFRESYMGDVCVRSSLRFAQLLAAHVNSFVHLYEINTITNGELVMEVDKQPSPPPGMENLHSLVPTCGAVLAAALSCATGPVITINNCACGLAMHYVASREAASIFKGKEAAPPGSLRQAFLDKLFKVDDLILQSKAKIAQYNLGVSPS